MDIDACATGIYYFHGVSFRRRGGGCLWRGLFSLTCSSLAARQRRKETAIAGSRCNPEQTDTRSRRRSRATSFARDVAASTLPPRPPIFIFAGEGAFIMRLIQTPLFLENTLWKFRFGEVEFRQSRLTTGSVGRSLARLRFLCRSVGVECGHGAIRADSAPPVDARPTVEVARDLLARCWCTGAAAGIIVETEAYLGATTWPSHSARGITPRTRVIFGPPGHAYVYFIYGMYECLNLVAEPEGQPGCVLIRAVEPASALPRAPPARPRSTGRLASGPGKLTMALAITAGPTTAPTSPAAP